MEVAQKVVGTFKVFSIEEFELAEGQSAFRIRLDRLHVGAIFDGSIELSFDRKEEARKFKVGQTVRVTFDLPPEACPPEEIKSK